MCIRDRDPVAQLVVARRALEQLRRIGHHERLGCLSLVQQLSLRLDARLSLVIQLFFEAVKEARLLRLVDPDLLLIRLVWHVLLVPHLVEERLEFVCRVSVGFDVAE